MQLGCTKKLQDYLKRDISPADQLADPFFSWLAVQQQNQNFKAIMQQDYSGIMGGSDSFTIIGASGIGKSSAISQLQDYLKRDISPADQLADPFFSWSADLLTINRLPGLCSKSNVVGDLQQALSGVDAVTPEEGYKAGGTAAESELQGHHAAGVQRLPPAALCGSRPPD